MDLSDRPISGAELFINESLMNALADIGDDAFDGEREICGSIIGARYEDNRGVWTQATGLSLEIPLEDAVGWFRSREGDGTSMSDDDVRRHVSMFGRGRAYAVMIDP